VFSSVSSSESTACYHLHSVGLLTNAAVTCWLAAYSTVYRIILMCLYI